MDFALDFLSRNNIERERFLKKVVTEDETWMAYVNDVGKIKQQTMTWKLTSFSCKPEKARATLSMRKIIVRVFWNAKVVLLVDFMKLVLQLLQHSTVKF